jgi:alcohol dehydrogenase
LEVILETFSIAESFLKEFKGDNYTHGLQVLSQVGNQAAKCGKQAVLIADKFPGSQSFLEQIINSLVQAKLTLLTVEQGAAPNCPREDLYRITECLNRFDPDVIISFGGGSTIDASKAADVIHTLGGNIDDYFGTGLVSQALEKVGKKLIPHVAIQTASSSAAHLSKYSNITDIKTGQKKLIIDNAIVPTYPVFDYGTTLYAPYALTADGAMDGLSHALEVLYSMVGQSQYPYIESVATECIRLVVSYLPKVMSDSKDLEARVALGFATDLGGYTIMIGGTNGAHLTSFSLVDILSHGRACGMLNPYYTVFFAPAIQEPLKAVGRIFKDAGYIHDSMDNLSGRNLGVKVAEGMINFQSIMGFPTRLNDVPGFQAAHIERVITAAKNPQLKSKLENMPVSLTADSVDQYMLPILEAAKTGDLSLIKNVHSEI